MKYRVHMLAFGKPGETRDVFLADSWVEKKQGNLLGLLDLIFQYGQNDFQPRPHQTSVSVGDVIDLRDDARGRYWMVAPIGFQNISKEEFDKYVSMDRRARQDHFNNSAV